MSAIKDSNSDSLVADAAKDHLKLLTSSDPDQVAGIVRFELLVSQEIETGGEIRVSTSSVDSDIIISDLSPGQSVTVGLHTHLLKNGAHKIAFELTEVNGAMCAVNVSISVENTSDLAQETATLLRENDTPVFLRGRAIPRCIRMENMSRGSMDRMPSSTSFIWRLLGSLTK